MCLPLCNQWHVINLTDSSRVPGETDYQRADRDAVWALLEGLPEGMGTTKTEIAQSLGWDRNRATRALCGTDRFKDCRCRVTGVRDIVYGAPAVIHRLANEGKVTLMP